MNYLAAFEISATGLSVERLRADIATTNLANMHTTRTAKGGAYTPLRATVTNARGVDFETHLNASELADARPQVTIESTEVPPRMVYEPGHPDANDKGFVAYPNINLVSEMVNLMTATRSYQANVSAFNSAKSMALKALEIGGRS